MFSVNKKFEYLEKSKKKQLEKYFSQENVEKRKKKAIEYQERIKARVKEKGGLKKFSNKMINLHQKDEEFYKTIWSQRKHYCENCNKFLGNNFRDLKGHIIVYRYAHIIPKSIYPYLRHYNDNIMLLCLDCHTKFDQSPKEVIKKMKCYDGEYIESLKELHKKLKQENNDIYK